MFKHQIMSRTSCDMLQYVKLACHWLILISQTFHMDSNEKIIHQNYIPSYIVTATKWPTFCRHLIEMHPLANKSIYQSKPHKIFHSRCFVDNRWVFDQVIAFVRQWWYFTGKYMHHHILWVNIIAMKFTVRRATYYYLRFCSVSRIIAHSSNTVFHICKNWHILIQVDS